jgi:hypothetical protein
MSVPTYSDGSAESIRLALSQGWLKADQYLSSFFSGVNREIGELFKQYSQQLKPAKNQKYDKNGAAIFSELPDNYALMNSTHDGTIVIVGHPRYLDSFLIFE